MATLRSSFPSRLRQLLSAQGAMSPSIKIVSETPPEIQAFIDKVIMCPLQDIEIPLFGFRWEYGKGNFNHWRPLFLHFDTYFKAYISGRNDLLLADELLEDDAPFPKQAVMQILRVMQIILDNCHNKVSFSGLEHFKLLLASTDPEILIASLETLSSLVKISPKLHFSGKLVGLGSINSCLLSLAQGWGSKEEGLGLYACVMLNEKSEEGGFSLFPSDVHNETDRSQYRVGSTLYLELHGVNSQNVKGSSVIHIPDLHLRKEDDLSLMEMCIKQYNVPPELRYLLLTRIRYAHSFRSSRLCKLYSRICLLAFGVLVQASDSHDKLVSFLANEPEYTNELIRIVKSEDTISGNIRTLAMHALGSQLAAYSSSQERALILSGSSISFSGVNRMILQNVLQRAILSMNSSNDPSSIAFVEALLQFYLLHVISTSSSRSVTRGAGIVPTFMPLFEDSDMSHLHLVFLAVKTLKKLMDYSNSAMALFRDLGGVELLMNRLQIEVDRVINAAADDKLMNSGESSRHYDDMIYSQKRLIRVLLKALGSATYSPANTLRTQNNASLPSTLSLIFKNLELFGGDIYSSAVSVMSEIIHKDPTCFPFLDELGLPDAFLSSVVVGILPSSKALMCVPNGLGAICLNAKGLEAVKKTAALRFLVDIFTNRKYVLAMSDAVVPLAKAVEELLRHVSSLKSIGVDLIIEIISKISLIGDSKLTASSEKVIGSTLMETDTDNKENRSSSLLVGETDPTRGGVNNEQFIQLSIFHVMILVHRAMENSETCRLFVERSGIEALLKLLLRPTIAQSSEGMSIAFHSTMVFKGFTQHHSAPLARAFCSSLKDQLEKALTAFDTVAGSFLLDPKVTPDSGIFSSLFLVEFLLFLGASKESRWVNSLLTEFGSGSKEVLEDIGRVQREVLWQVALLEDAKLQIKDDGTDSGEELRQPESSTNEVEDQRVNSFRDFLDPLLSRRMSGWSFESQIFDLISMYHDLTHASGLQQRQGGNGTSDLRRGASQRLHQPGAAVSIGSSGKKEDDKQKSYYSSCCDMVKSLSSHITRLFQELGRAMFLSSRRRDDLVNVSPSSKSVASIVASIALGHMSFGGNVLSGLEASVSVKCRYFGKVIEFIDSILLDKPESCNPVMLNALYGRGVVQSVLTTFEATSQLLFTVNGTPASPMDTDEGILKQDDLDETGHSWIHGSLISYGKLMDHLVTSSFVLVPFTKHLLTQPLVNGDVPFPRDAETLVKALQSATLKVLLPVWTHPQFSDCNHDFIATVVSIIRHIYSGVEVKNVSNAVSRSSGPPPSETTISTIVEMGFSRPRAEEALRQVGLSSVELAMEWLFSHPEEVQEEDELARALAMSLGSSGSDIREDLTNEISEQQIEEEVVQLPPVGDLLSTCRKLLHMKDSLAFPVRDLLILICSRNNGEYRLIVISYIIEQVKLSSAISDSGTSNMLASLFHVIALILNEDVASREVASMNGLVKVTSDMLSDWSSGLHDKGISQVPKWVSAAFVAIDRLAQVDQKLSDDILELLKNGDDGSQRSLVINDEKPYKPGSANGFMYIDIQEQKSLVEIACSCMRYELPSQTTHAVLQLCSSLTRSHSVALGFLDAGGLPLLLSLPTSSMFVGFDNVAAAIIRHILEDPQTLQQSMEHEIKHSIATAANRQSNGRLTPHNFLLNLTSVISRDPVIFLRAAQSVCQVEMVSERPYIALLKDREKDKLKEKGKEKERGEEKDKSQSSDGKGVHGKLIDINSKNAKVHRKPPQSFVNVIELLLDSIITFFPTENEMVTRDCSSSIDMDIDVAASKGKGKAVASAPEEIEVNKQESSASVAKILFILKLLTEILMMYGSSVHVLLRKDVEVISCRSVPHKGPAGMCSGGILYHILHEFLPCSQNSRKDKKIVVDWRHKLASNAGQFLVATCVRSAEARKRVFMEIGYVFKDFVDSSEGFRPPESIIQAFVDFINDVLVARTPTGSCISAEASITFIDLGLVRSITRALHILDLDHGDSPKVASGIVKILEVVTKEHVQAAENNARKVESSTKPSEQGPAGRTDSGLNTSQAMEAILQPNVAYVPSHHVESINTLQIYGESENITDDMEHDQDYDGGSALPNEDDYMHETSDDARVLQTGLNTIGVTFEIQTDVNENLEEDDEDMSGDEGEEDDEDGDHEEHNNLEEEVAYLPHPDTDQDDHENDEDEFDEEIMEEDDDEDDDDDEDEGLILRLGDGMNGTNMLDQIEAFDGDQNISNELHVMPVDLFGSRRQGRTTSIYNLLGRTGDSASTTQHPLLEEPVSALHSISPRRLETVRDIFAGRNSESSSLRVDSVLRSLRTGRHAHRLNLWGDNNHQSGGSNASAVPQGLEDLLVSRLTLAEPKKPSGENTVVEPHSKGEAVQPQQDMIVEAAAGDNRNSETIYTTPVPSSTSPDASASCHIRPAVNGLQQVADLSLSLPQSVEMQFEHTDAVGQDVEAVSLAGSEATVGESLRGLDVEVGHDDAAERQGEADTRTRRVNMSLGNAAPLSGTDVPLHSANEVSGHPSQEAGQAATAEEQQNGGDADSRSIDPAFLDALPEELRAEVLSAQQGQTAQPSNTEPESQNEDIDPEFLAALPPDIREEVLAQQQAQRLHQSRELEGQPVEMDTVSIIATFPSELREEVLLTSSDAILANLTPALVAEANMLRERFAHRYNGTLFGMHARNRRGESSRRGDRIGSILDRTGGVILRRSLGSKAVEADGAPLVDTEDLKALVRLLRVVQPLYKGHLQRLLLNLCAHNETRTALVKILVEFLMLDMRRPTNLLGSLEPSFRLYACQSHVAYSRPQYFDGVPPLVSRRVLETLTYLARSHPLVAKLFFQFSVHQSAPESSSLDMTRGKAVMVDEDKIEKLEHQEEHISIKFLLSLLNQPLYLRSIAHLEQLLNLLDVIIDNAESKPKSSDAPGPSLNEQVSAQITTSDAEINTGSAGTSSGSDARSSKADDTSKLPVSNLKRELDSEDILHNLPREELRFLCSLLAREGMSDKAYALVAEVLKKLVTIVPVHCHLLISELAVSIQNLTKSAMNELHIFGEVERAIPTAISSDGAAVLRVLQAVSSLVATLSVKDKNGQVLSEKEHAAALALLGSINASLDPLWLELSTCVGKIERYSDSPHDLLTSSVASTSKPPRVMPPLPAGTQNILPYLESFFVMCEKLNPLQSGAGHDLGGEVVSDVEEATTSDSKPKATGSAHKVDEKQIAFIKFSDKHKKLLNAFIRQNPGLLEKSFSLMLKVPRVIDFDNKRAHFRSKIKHDHHHGALRISVRRAYILEDSYNQLRMRSTQDLRGRLNVHFQGEEGIDAGGLTREWYQLLSRVIFDKGALLFTTVGNESTFQPNPNSVYQTEHLSYFKFVGRVVAKALLDGQLLDVHFTRSFYKHILGVKVTYHDIEAIDPDYFKNLKWMLENDISDILDLTFSIDADEEKLILYERAQVTDYELCENGRNIRVTEENKHEYVDLVAEHRLTTAIRPQINAFLEGFNELIQRDLISIFNDKELELLISGLPDIDLDDMRMNTEYSGYSVASPVIQWFWEVVRGFSKEDKARLLQFVTGTSKVPLEGFSALQGISGSQKFQIHKAYGSTDHLPSAHTCFNQLDLPEYPTKQHLEERLLLAIHEANEGFGFG